MRSCDFCLIPKTKTTDTFIKLYGNLRHTLNIPGIPAGLTVLQDAVPLAEFGAHLLLMPNTHYISIASFNDQAKIKIARDIILSNLKKHFQYPIFMFEHGPGFIQGEPIACGGCHVDHAHAHFLVLPKKISFERIKEKVEESLIASGWYDPKKNVIQTDQAFINLDKITKNQPYIHMAVQPTDGPTIAYTYIQKQKSHFVASQLLRTVIADVVYNQKDSAFWHWRDVVDGLTSPQRKQDLKRLMYKFREITNF